MSCFALPGGVFQLTRPNTFITPQGRCAEHLLFSTLREVGSAACIAALTLWHIATAHCVHPFPPCSSSGFSLLCVSSVHSHSVPRSNSVSVCSPITSFAFSIPPFLLPISSCWPQRLSSSSSSPQTASSIPLSRTHASMSSNLSISFLPSLRSRLTSRTCGLAIHSRAVWTLADSKTSSTRVMRDVECSVVLLF